MQKLLKKKKYVFIAIIAVIFICVALKFTVFSKKDVDPFTTITDQTAFDDYLNKPIGLPVNPAEVIAFGPFHGNKDGGTGNFHSGFDFLVDHEGVSYYAIDDMTVESIDLFQDFSQQTNHPQVNIMFKGEGPWSYFYAFEPFGSQQADADKQLTMISVEEGQKLKKGDLVGKLHYVADGAHVHVSVLKDDTHSCYESLFSPEDKAKLIPLVRVTADQEKKLCYY